MMPLWLFYALMISGVVLIALGLLFRGAAPFDGIAIALGIILVIGPSLAVLLALVLYQSGLLS